MMNDNVVRIFSIDIEKLKRRNSRLALWITALTFVVGFLTYEVYLLDKYIRERLG